MMSFKKNTFILTLFLVLAATNTSAQWVFMKSDGDSLVNVGIDAIYNVEFDKAHTSFERVIELYPDHPAGYFMDAMIDWWKIVLDIRSRSNDAQFERKIQRVLDICDRILEKQPNDIVALFFRGGSLGFIGRFHAMRKNYLDAASTGKEALDVLNACQKLAPGNHDIMLGTGIYNYYAAIFPEKYPVLKPLMMFLPRGDRELGLLQLKAAAEKARYSSVEAKVLLISAYYEFEQNASAAYPYALELATKYPNNPSFQRWLGRCLVKLGKLDTMEIVWRKVIVNYMDKRYGYDMYAAREALYYIGLARMFARDYEIALKYFYKCDEASRTLDKEGPSGFMVKLNMKVGQIYDLQGKRALAIDQYNKVLSFNEYETSHDDARRYLQTPFR
jgi:tetratricopeptide (TPR) repeat protein